MPCANVTVQGPEITGEVRLSNYSVGGGREVASYSYLVQNSTNVTMSVTVEVTLDGSVEETHQHQLSPGGSESVENSIQVSGLNPGSEQTMNLCADIVSTQMV